MFLALAGCSESSTEASAEKDKSDMEVAEAYIESFEPKKAVPYLENISADEPEYARAQELLSTINGLTSPKQTEAEVAPIESQTLNLTEAQTKKLKNIQGRWAKKQIREYGRYFSSYRIESPVKAIFVLGKQSSLVGSIQSHEETNVPVLLDAYREAFKKSGLAVQPMQISFERQGGIKSDLSTSNTGWVPAEYLYEGVGVYFGQGNEKRFLGTTVRGYAENGQEYVVLETSNHEEVKTKAFITENANCFLKIDDPKYQGKLLHYN